MKVGLEIHVFLKTNAKLFCNCSTGADKPNASICDICTSQPGTKPLKPNIEAVKKAFRIANFLNCKLNRDFSIMRKHYFYPDLPSNYQRLSTPIGERGNFSGIEITEVHFEEDAGKYDINSKTVDFNRAGFPLVEIVTEPDFSSIAQVKDFLEQLRTQLFFFKVCKKQPFIKVDVNVSFGSERVEVKNINSIQNIVSALIFETERQKKLIHSNLKVKMETRGFDEKKGITFSLRSKEAEKDYRFIFDPDFYPFEFDFSLADFKDFEKEKKEIMKKTSLNESEFVFLIEKDLLDLFLSLQGIPKKELYIFLTRDLLGELNFRKIHSDFFIEKKFLEDLLEKRRSKQITHLKSIQILRNYLDKKDADETVHPDLDSVIEEVLLNQKEAVKKYLKGRKNVFFFLIGQIQKKSSFAFDHELIESKLRKKLEK